MSNPGTIPLLQSFSPIPEWMWTAPIPVSFWTTPIELPAPRFVWISAAGTELSGIDRQLDSLEEREEEPHHQIVASHNGVAINDILPTEILREIFISCGSAGSTDGSLAVYLNRVLRAGSEVRMTLCHVYLRIRFDYRPEPSEGILDFDRAFALLDVWLYLGGDCPLELALLWTNEHPRILQTLVKSCATHSILKVLLSPIWIDNLARDLASSAKNTTVFLAATRLRCVTLRGFPSMKLNALAIRWHRLTELFIEEGKVPMKELYSILPFCIRLTRAGFRKATDPSFGLSPSVPYRAHRDPVPFVWLAASNLAEEVFLPHSPLGEQLVTMISEGALLPYLRLLVVPAQDFGPAMPMIRARLSSSQSSTITEFGISGRVRDLWRVDMSPNKVDELMAAGVFICDEMVSEGFGDPVTPCRGEIEKRARDCYRKGVGLYEYSEEDKEEDGYKGEDDSSDKGAEH
ncbi:hypothetical protein FB45DRAFT_1061911 [Roridomyces roridus]|uniref:Uncharacterized protein n=1 Tax=Roridomyces roridus TaxID=1738132 RepID=A0AAD7FIJ7_9AGAR|nr:hypothetical protein FB45DRAFT_1061911 [Roridomyces roridus]